MKSLEELYTISGILVDNNEDGYADDLKGYVVLDEDSSLVEKEIAVNLCGRLGYETMGLDLPIVKVGKDLEYLDGTNIYLNPGFFQYDLEDNKSLIRLESSNNHNFVVFSAGSEKALIYGGEYLYSKFPYVWNVKKDCIKLDAIKEDIMSNIPVLEVNIFEMVFDCRYKGIHKLTVELVSDDIAGTAKKLEGLKDKFKWPNIGQIDFIITDESDKKIMSVENEKLEENKLEEIRLQEKEEHSLKDMDISNIYTLEGLFNDTNEDLLPDELDTKIVIPDDADDFELIAACNVAARLALETLGIKFPIVCSERNFDRNIKNSIIIGRAIEIANKNLDEKSEIQVLREKENNFILIKGKGEELIKTSQYFAQTLPNISNNKEGNYVYLKEELEEIFKGESFDGQLVKLFSNLEAKDDLKDKSLKCYFDISSNNSERMDDIKNYAKDKLELKDVEIGSYKDSVKLWEKEYDIPWEVDEFKTIFSEKVCSKIKPDDKVEVFGLLSEEEEVRDSLKAEIRKAVDEKGGEVENLDIYCAYKQGFSWIAEDIVPEIKNIAKDDEIDKIVISFKRFVDKDNDDWDEIDGSQPSYNAYTEDNERWFDLPIRWLQELYPIDDLMARELNMDRDKIVFEMIDEDSENTYEVSVIDKENTEVMNKVYNAKYSERSYLDEYPKIGKVHPSTGWITVKINGEVVVDENIKTDLENMWDIYQREILKECKEYILERTDGNPTADKQPFFKQLRFDIFVSEPDYDLGIREDRISALDAFHEDIYFVALDFFKTLGERTVGEGLGEPGMILPFMEKRNGKKPYMKVSLSKEKYDAPIYFLDDSSYYIEKDSSINVEINRLQIEDGKVEEVEVGINSSNNEYTRQAIKSLSKLHDNGLIKLDKKMNIPRIKFNLIDKDGKTEYEQAIDIGYELDEITQIKSKYVDATVPEGEIIGYDEYLDIIEKLKYRPEINVWKGGTSYQGRDIYVVDVTSPFNTKLVSRNKLINLKPTYMLVNRHHANEISSTSSSLRLIEKCIYDKNYKEYLKKINLAIIPVENVDGTYIHYELQKQNPNWKLHVARFNSVGKEMNRGYVEKDTKYGECKVRGRVWRKWLPDMVVDNHGVPSHEWDQQFAGYVAPWFRGFWIPRGLYYGLFYLVDQPEYAKAKEIAKGMQDKVADWINSEEDIMEYQMEFKDRFEKYASKWMPNMFPAEYYKDLIFYWVSCDPNDKKNHHESHKHPNITVIDWITEISDETAQGDYLDLCAKTHHTADMAIIDMLYNVETEIEDLSNEYSDGIEIRRLRKRPISLD